MALVSVGEGGQRTKALVYKKGDKEGRIDITIWIEGVLYFVDVVVCSTQAASHFKQSDQQIQDEIRRLKVKTYGDAADTFEAVLVVFQIDVMGGVCNPAYTLMKKIAEKAIQPIRQQFFRDLVCQVSTVVQAYNGEIVLAAMNKILAIARTMAVARQIFDTKPTVRQNQPYPMFITPQGDLTRHSDEHGGMPSEVFENSVIPDQDIPDHPANSCTYRDPSMNTAMYNALQMMPAPPTYSAPTNQNSLNEEVAQAQSSPAPSYCDTLSSPSHVCKNVKGKIVSEKAKVKK